MSRGCAYLSDAKASWATQMCVSEISKDLKGELVVRDVEEQDCERLRCRTLKVVHGATLEVSGHDCDSAVAHALDGRLLVRRLVTAHAHGDALARGTHTGTVRWVGQGMLVGGTINGITHAGTHREPAFEAVQKCAAPGFMEGLLQGVVLEAEDKALVGCCVRASYRWRFDPAEKPQDSALVGTLEGVLVCRCSPEGSCLTLATQGVGTHPNPWSVGGYGVTVLDHVGAPHPDTQVVTWGGVTGLNLGHEAHLNLPAAAGQVSLTLAHFSAPASLEALSGGVVVDTATMSVGGGTPQQLTVTAAGIDAVRVIAPQNETLLVQICS